MFYRLLVLKCSSEIVEECMYKKFIIYTKVSAAPSAPSLTLFPEQLPLVENIYIINMNVRVCEQMFSLQYQITFSLTVVCQSF